MKKEYDLILFGATSFVGKIMVRYMLEKYGENSDVKWAIAARSETKLRDLKQELGSKSESIPTFIADIVDEQSLIELTEQAEVLVSTVGPYAIYGEPMVKACVDTGTHYCDLTGETQWIYDMQKKYEKQAQESGAMIVHCCGFDSVPSDMGVWFLQREANKEFGKSCDRVEMFVKVLKGWISGGTAASMVNVVKAVKQEPKLRKVLANPYSICPSDHKFTAKQPTKLTGYSKTLNSWWAPFIMAAINTRVVHRTNALLNSHYGERFIYQEATLVGKGFKGGLIAKTMAGSLALVMLGLYFSPTRWLLEKYALPKPGEGPSPQAQEKGFYDLRFVGTCESGEQLIVKVTGDKDPGYGSTAKMLAESALCVANDVAQKEGGFWTPASLMAEQLLERLTTNAGLTFESLKPGK